MNECIFSSYHTNGQECDRAYECEGCEVHNSMNILVKAVNAERENETNEKGEPCTS